MLPITLGAFSNTGGSAGTLFYQETRTGNNSNTPINAGMDIAGAGGLYIGKRLAVSNWGILDTERGTNLVLNPSERLAQASVPNALASFDSTGVTVGTDNYFNANGTLNINFLFLQEAGFLDVISYIGDGTNKVVPHSLGTEIGHIIVRNATTGQAWVNWHRGFGTTDYLILDSTAAKLTNSSIWGSAGARDTTQFPIGTSATTNSIGDTHVAYVFAHNPAKKIFCGNFTGTGAAGNKQTIGFKPKMIIVKSTSSAIGWIVLSAIFPNSNANSFGDFLTFDNNNDIGLASAPIISEDDGFSFTGISGGNIAARENIFIAIG